MISPAKENFARFSAEKIRLLEGDAADILPTFTEKFDFIFLDARKRAISVVPERVSAPS